MNYSDWKPGDILRRISETQWPREYGDIGDFVEIKETCGQFIRVKPVDLAEDHLESYQGHTSAEFYTFYCSAFDYAREWLPKSAKPKIVKVNTNSARRLEDYPKYVNLIGVVDGMAIVDSPLLESHKKSSCNRGWQISRQSIEDYEGILTLEQLLDGWVDFKEGDDVPSGKGQVILRNNDKLSCEFEDMVWLKGTLESLNEIVAYKIVEDKVETQENWEPLTVENIVVGAEVKGADGWDFVDGRKISHFNENLDGDSYFEVDNKYGWYSGDMENFLISLDSVEGDTVDLTVDLTVELNELKEKLQVYKDDAEYKSDRIKELIADKDSSDKARKIEHQTLLKRNQTIQNLKLEISDAESKFRRQSQELDIVNGLLLDREDFISQNIETKTGTVQIGRETMPCGVKKSLGKRIFNAIWS